LCFTISLNDGTGNTGIESFRQEGPEDAGDGKGEEQSFPGEELFRSLLENSPDVIDRFDRELRHPCINPAVLMATGVPPAEFIGKTHEDLGMPAHLCSYWAREPRKVFESGIPSTNVEFTYETPRGRRHYQSYLVPELAEDGSVKTVLAVSREVTDKKNVEFMLKETLADIEERVRRKTDELRQANESLESEIAERRQAEENHVFLSVGGYFCASYQGIQRESRNSLNPEKRAVAFRFAGLYSAARSTRVLRDVQVSSVGKRDRLGFRGNTFAGERNERPEDRDTFAAHRPAPIIVAGGTGEKSAPFPGRDAAQALY
jgi:PAS domain S-box-containing protein